MALNGKYTLPDELYYDSANHLWLRQESDGAITVGLDALGLEAMGDMAYISFDKLEREVLRGEPLGSLEAAKMVAPLLAPISGKIVKTNDAVARNPRLVNTSPYAQGWLFTITPTRWAEESAQLVSGAENIARFLDAELERYRAQGWVE